MKILETIESGSLKDECNAFLREWENSSDEIILTTSGSTGVPKKLLVKKEWLMNSAQMTGYFFHLEADKTALLCMSPKYIGGKMMIIRALIHDMELLLAPVSSNPLKNWKNKKIDFAAMVPLQIKTILKENPEKLDFIQQLIIGGAPLQNKEITALNQFATSVYETFGMTETLSHVALKNIKDEKSVFEAIGDIKFSLVDNCLQIHAPMLGHPFLQTNDVVDLLTEKSFIWKGRADFVINSGGVKIHPEEVEQMLERILPSDCYFIYGIPDKRLGEKVVLILEEGIDFHSQKINSIFDHLPYWKPKEIIYSSKIIRTPNNKINRLATIKSLGFE